LDDAQIVNAGNGKRHRWLLGDTVVIAHVGAWIGRACGGVLAIALMGTSSAAVLAQPASYPVSPSIETTPRRATNPIKGLMTVSDSKTSATRNAEMAAAAILTTKVLAIGTWTAKATPETRPPIMPSEARDTMRLMLAGKIDQWFAKIDGSGAVFLMNVTDPAEAHALLEKLPLGQADMMRFDLIPVGPLWPLGLLLREPVQ
jgi:hypothetical protein